MTYFKYINTACSQRLDYIILKALKRQGLSLELLHCVFNAIIVNKIMYAISAWYCFLNKSHLSYILKRAFKYGYVKLLINVEQLLQDYDDKLFTKATYGNRAICSPIPSLLVFELSVMACLLTLLNLKKKTFINRLIFSDCY